MWRRKIFIGTAVGAVVLGGVWLWAHHGPAPEYETTPLRRGEIRSMVSATGTCSAVVTVQVGSQVSGNIKALYADFNSKVHRGDLVAQIDPEPFQARLAQAQAARDSARTSIGTAKANAAKAQADVASARAQRANLEAAVVRSKVAENDAKVKLDRRKSMVSDLIISPEDLDTAEATYKSAVAEREAAEAQVQAADAAIQAADAGYRVATAQVESAVAQSKQADATLEQAKLDLSHTRITAPVDGVVISRNVDVGQTVAASFQTPTLFVIAQDLTRMQVDTDVDEADIGHIRVGQTARFTVDAYPTTDFQAKVDQIRKAPITNQNVVTYDVVLAVSNPNLQLFPGMTANVRILTDVRRNVLKLPNAALRFRPAGAVIPTGGRRGAHGRQNDTQTVYVLDASGHPAARPVKLGISDGTYTEITSGDLHEGDPIILVEQNGPTEETASNSRMFRRPRF